MPLRFLSRLATAYLRLDIWLLRMRQAGVSVATGFFSNVLTIDEQSDVSIRVYETAFGREGRRELRDWEKDWFERRLPAAPARILVGAAGMGPEVIHLTKLGYVVDAFDPSSTASSACATVGAEIVAECRYEDLSSAVLDGAQILRGLATQHYDAAILGLGSFSHLLDPDERLRLLSACDQICPNGPILASFVDVIQNSSPGRGRELGNRLGLLVKRLRRKVHKYGDASRLCFGAAFGFLHLFTNEEVEELATRIGRRVIWEVKHADPHVTLVKD